MQTASHHHADWADATPAEHFTGEVSMAPLGDSQGIRATAVRFQPGARTDWHHHPSGQVLHVVDGRGHVVTAEGDRRDIVAGDTVTAPPGEVHWHGASSDEPMTHLSVIATETEWVRPVTEEEYLG